MKRLFLFILLTPLFLIGCKEKVDSVPQEATKYKTFISVQSSTSQEAELKRYIKSSGHTQAVNRVDIQAEMNSQIVEVSATNNSFVKQGDPLLLLDSRSLDIQRAEAQIKHNKVLAEYSAWMKTYPQSDSISLATQTGVNEAQLSLDQLDLAIERCKINAPISGILTNFDYSVGSFVNMNQKLASVIDNSHQKLVVDILENEISQVVVGAEVIISFPTLKSKNYHGFVESISPKLDVITSAGEIVISLKEQDEIRSGMFAEVKIEVENLGNKLLIPKEALLVRNGRELLFTVSADGKSVWKYVTSGSANEYVVEIVEGLQANEKVIVSGNFVLAHDANLKLEKEIPFLHYYTKF